MAAIVIVIESKETETVRNFPTLWFVTFKWALDSEISLITLVPPLNCSLSCYVLIILRIIYYVFY